MTIEEWIASKVSLPASSIKFLGVKDASPGHYWSEYTQEDFDAWLLYEHAGEEKHLWIGKSDVCDFLCSCFPVQKKGPAEAGP